MVIRNFVAGTLWGVVVAGVGLAVVSQVAPMPGATSGAGTDVAVANSGAAPEGGSAVVPTPGSAPVEPALKSPAPAKPVPAKPVPAKPVPAKPAPAKPVPAEPAPAKPVPAEPAPAEPAPAEPAAAEPVPANTVPAVPPAAPAAPAPELADLEPAAPAPAVSPDIKPANPAVVSPPAPPAIGVSDDQLALGEAAIAPGARTTAPAVAEAPPALDPPDAAPDAATANPVLPKPGDPAPSVAAPGDAPLADLTDAVPGAVDAPPPAAPLASEALLDPAPQIKANPAPATIAPDVPVENAALLPPTTTDAPGADITAAKPKTSILQPVIPLVPAPSLFAKDRPSVVLPKPGATAAQDDGVTSNRLPSIGAPGADDAAPETAPPPGDVPPGDLPPVQQFAQSFENPSGKPLFAVILRDTGAADVDRAALAALPFPVSFVIDPLAPNAASAAAIYRAAGQEVILLASGIPPGALASDLEQTFQTTAAALPQAVAVMDLPQDGFQDNRPLASLVVPIVKTQGRGLITFDRGLNAADQVARREDVPSATIFRQLDGAGEDLPLIRRYLDRAAFKAAQEGRVMVLGDTRAETIAALMEWTVEGRASSVSLAPATAVLSVD